MLLCIGLFLNYPLINYYDDILILFKIFNYLKYLSKYLYYLKNWNILESDFNLEYFFHNMCSQYLIIDLAFIRLRDDRKILQQIYVPLLNDIIFDILLRRILENVREILLQNFPCSKMIGILLLIIFRQSQVAPDYMPKKSLIIFMVGL